MISSIKFSSKNLSHEQMKVKKRAASMWSVFGWYIQRLEGLHLIKTTIHDCCDIVCPKVSVYKWVIERFFLFWIERCCWKMKFWNRHWKQFCWKRWEFCDHIVWHVSVKECDERRNLLWKVWNGQTRMKDFPMLSLCQEAFSMNSMSNHCQMHSPWIIRENLKIRMWKHDWYLGRQTSIQEMAMGLNQEVEWSCWMTDPCGK